MSEERLESTDHVEHPSYLFQSCPVQYPTNSFQKHNLELIEAARWCLQISAQREQPPLPGLEVKA